MNPAIQQVILYLNALCIAIYLGKWYFFEKPLDIILAIVWTITLTINLHVYNRRNET